MKELLSKLYLRAYNQTIRQAGRVAALESQLAAVPELVEAAKAIMDRVNEASMSLPGNSKANRTVKTSALDVVAGVTIPVEPLKALRAALVRLKPEEE